MKLQFFKRFMEQFDIFKNYEDQLANLLILNNWTFKLNKMNEGFQISYFYMSFKILFTST